MTTGKQGHGSSRKFFSQIERCQSGCVCGREGDGAESGSARVVRLVRVPGDRPLGDLKSSLIALV